MIALVAATCGCATAALVQAATGSVWLATVAGVPVTIGVVFGVVRLKGRP